MLRAPGDYAKESGACQGGLGIELTPRPACRGRCGQLTNPGWERQYPAMMIQSLSGSEPFVTRDGSLIRSILDRSNAPVENQSLAEATVQTGGSTERHFHRVSEEFYFILEGVGEMEVDGETREVHPGDAILIPPGAWHQIRATDCLRFLCCCAPPYSHEDTFFEAEPRPLS